MPLTRLKSADAAARWLAAWTTGTLRSDSRLVAPGDAFVAWPGHSGDGRRHVRQALAAGAATCLVEAEGVDVFGFDDARVAALPGLKAATGAIAGEFFGRPGERLLVAAVTGTNGKTSSAWWLAQALTALGRRCGVVGTLGIGEPPAARPDRGGGMADGFGSVVATGLTTPDPLTLHAALRRFADAGFAACAMEASSIGIAEHRLAGVPVNVALLTNFTPDHLDYHGDMAAYWAAKRRLFAWPGLRAAVVNVDDAAGAALAAELHAGVATDAHVPGGAATGAAAAAAAPSAARAAVAAAWTSAEAAAATTNTTATATAAATVASASGATATATATSAAAAATAPSLRAIDVWTVAVGADARLRADDVRYVDGGLAFTLREGGVAVDVRSTLIGDYNAHNLLGVLAALRALGLALAEAAAVVPLLTPVPGRMQRVTAAGVAGAVTAVTAVTAGTADAVEVVVDYAHTPDALDKALRALLLLAAARGGRLWCVFGCGGDRDRSKRAPMGAIAARLAHRVVVTSDNPRSEAPAAIAAQVLAGAAGQPHVQVVQDRGAAIEQAIGAAAAADVVVIAGKGHEDYQEVAGGVRLPFSDAVAAAAALARRALKGAAC